MYDGHRVITVAPDDIVMTSGRSIRSDARPFVVSRSRVQFFIFRRRLAGFPPAVKEQLPFSAVLLVSGNYFGAFSA